MKRFEDQEKSHQGEIHEYQIREMKMAFEEQRRFTECKALQEENDRFS